MGKSKFFSPPLCCVVGPLEELPVRHPALVPHLRADRVGLGVAESRTSAVSLVRQTDGDEAKGRLHSGDAAHALEVGAASHLLCILLFCQIMVCLTICFFYRVQKCRRPGQRLVGRPVEQAVIELEVLLAVGAGDGQDLKLEAI